MGEVLSMNTDIELKLNFNKARLVSNDIVTSASRLTPLRRWRVAVGWV